MYTEAQPRLLSFSTSFFFYIRVQLIYNVVLVSAAQQSDSVIHVSFLFSDSFHIQFITEYWVEFPML